MRVVVAAVLVAVAIAAILLIVPRLSEACCADPSAPASGGDTGTRPDGAVALTVDHVYDGDSLRAIAVDAEGFADGEVEARLIGIDAPEGTPTQECGAQESQSALRGLLPDGATVWVVPGAEPRDRYDRALVYAWTDEGAFLNAEQLRAGHARTLSIEPNTEHAATFADAERTAQQSGSGIWLACE